MKTGQFYKTIAKNDGWDSICVYEIFKGDDGKKWYRRIFRTFYDDETYYEYLYYDNVDNYILLDDMIEWNKAFVFERRHYKENDNAFATEFSYDFSSVRNAYELFETEFQKNPAGGCVYMPLCSIDETTPYGYYFY